MVQPDRQATWYNAVYKAGVVSAGLLIQEYGHLYLVVIVS